MILLDRRPCIMLLGFLAVSFFSTSAQEIYKPRKSYSQNPGELIRALRLQTETELATIKSKRKSMVVDRYTKRLNDLIKSVKQGIFIDDDSLQQMVDRVVTRLIDFNAINHVPRKVLIQKNPTPNAFCYGEGTFVITVGLLSHIENESQLGFALAHELAHYELDHVKARILQQIESDYEKKTRHELGKIFSGKADEGDVGILRTLVYDISRFNREKELQADSLGFIYFRNAGYHQPEALSLLALLDTAQQNAHGLQAELFLPFDAPNYPFQAEWLKKRLSLYSKKYENTLIFQSDSVSSHPDIAIRVEALAMEIDENNGQFNYQDEEFLAAVNRLAAFESVESAFFLKQYDRCLHLALELFARHPDDPYLVSVIGRVLDELYGLKGTEIFPFYVPKYTGHYGAQLRLVNDFLNNVTKEELAEIAYHFLNRQSHFDERNEHHYFLLWKLSGHTHRAGLQKKIKETYFARFGKGRFYGLMR